MTQRRGGENLAITRRREMEDRRLNIEQSVSRERAVNLKADWERKTDMRIQRNAVTTYARSLERKAQATLRERRQRLAELYQQDDEVHARLILDGKLVFSALVSRPLHVHSTSPHILTLDLLCIQIYRRELAGLQETSAQKARRMVAHARALKQEREEKRRQLAQELYNRQWREGCDDLRLIDSEKFKHYCMNEIDGQLKDRVQRREVERAEEQQWADVLEQGRQRELEKEAEKALARQDFNNETKNALLDQMDKTRQRREMEARAAEEERQAFQRQMEEDERQAKEQAYLQEKAKKAQMQKIKEFNDKTFAARRQAAERQRLQEMYDLEMKLEMHRQETDQKGREKQKMREDIAAYQQYLRDRKEEERKMEAELDRLCKLEMDKVNSKRDMQWMKERLAREKLMKEVYESRREQIARKEAEKFRREEEILREKEEIDREMAQARALEEEEARLAVQKEKDRAVDLQRQVDAVRIRRMAEVRHEM